MTSTEQREAARQFINRWRAGGDEKQDCHAFWLQLLHDVLGAEDVTEYIRFEKPVKLPEGDGRVHTRYIDGYIPEVKVLIEQKGSKHALDEREPQSGGELLTPYEQAKRYNDNLPYEEKARWIVTCNFRHIWIYDMNAPVPEPTKIELDELQSRYTQLDFLIKRDVRQLTHEMEVSIKAGDIVGLIYDALLRQYGIPDAAPRTESDEERERREHKLRSLNALCVRLVFLFYAEDAGIFERNQFHDYLDAFPAAQCRKALIDLFRILDTPLERRDEYLEEELAAFPYVNGGLFADEDIIIPQISEDIRRLLLDKASADFNWRDISPTIFGAVFESTLNPETRRAGGMHYTSVENIHKVIDPLFMDDLRAQFREICDIRQPGMKRTRLEAFQEKLASIVCLDPAAGSGNFLTESYLSLRRLENEVIAERTGRQISMAQGREDLIRVSIQQFYGIEINDFAVTVAKTALWIAESQMLEETKALIYGFHQDFLPLRTYVNITEGNALRLNWGSVVPRERLTYIIGNPPFVGYSLQSRAQKEDILSVYVDEKGKPYKTAGKIDYVAGWYFKAAQLMQDSAIRAAFVSTNSITQGEQVSSVWRPLYERFGIHIDFAHRTFRWDSEASLKAHVHCVIVGFSCASDAVKDGLDGKDSKSEKNVNVGNVGKERAIYTEGYKQKAGNINAYLLDAPDIFIDSRIKPICDVPGMTTGNRPADGGNLIIEDEDYADFIAREPLSKSFIKRLVGSAEFINNKRRWCLWLVGVSPTELRNMPLVMERVAACKEDREKAPDAGRRKLADTPALFREQLNPDSFILVPRVSSERRRYVPMGFMNQDSIVTDSVLFIPDAGLYHFGILTSNVHMAWMRAVCGRLEMRYRYSKDIVYNNFPWPSPADEQRARIEQSAQAILDARALYPDASLADLYDPLTMPSELRRAHTANDKAVMAAYGFSTQMSETDCVAELMRMYQRLIG